MQTSTAVFVGIGTVVVAIAVGLSGGLIANVMSPQPLKQGVATARLEQRAPPEQMPASDAVPYVGAALAFIDPSVGGTAAHDQKAAASQAAEAAAPGDQATRPADTPASTSETESSQQGTTDKAASAPEDAYANARAADQRRGAERRRAERAHRWVYRHRREWDQYRYSYDQQPSNDSNWYSDRRYRQNYYVQQPRYDYRQFGSFGPK